MVFKFAQYGYESFQNVAPILFSVIYFEITNNYKQKA